MKHAHSEEKSSLCAFSLSVRNGMVLLLLHRYPDLGVILLVQGALGEFAGVGVHFDAVAGGEMRLPELGDRLLRPLIGEGPGAAQDGKGFLLRFAVGWILSHGRIFFSIFLALFCPNWHCPRSGLTGGDCSFDYRTAGVHSGPELPEEPESPEPPVEAG